MMLPLPKWTGRPELHARRSLVDTILYGVRTGCSWRQLPVDFPPWQTVYWYFTRWNARGVTERILDESVVAASAQDRDGAKSVLLSMYLGTPIRFVFADGGFAGRLVDWVARFLKTTLHIAHRRLARDYGRDPEVSESMIRWAAINQMIRRLSRGAPATRQPRWRWPDPPA